MRDAASPPDDPRDGTEPGAVDERAGRAQDKEHLMERLRDLGSM